MKHLLYLHWQSASRALVRILRQPFSSLLNLLILSIALALPLSLHILVTSVQDWVARLNTTPQITLFMKTTADKADLAAIDRTLQKQANVATLHFISKRQALAQIERQNGLEGITEGLEKNPLPDAFVITPTTLDPLALEIMQKELSGLPMVESAQLDTHWAKRLFSMIELGKKITILLATVLGIALILVTHNTIRLQVLARRDEIEVSKLIGAPDSFIRRPFLYHACWQGILAALIAWGLTLWLINTANPALLDFAQLYNEHIELHGLGAAELCAVITGAAALAIFGARLASDHHLRHIEGH